MKIAIDAVTALLSSREKARIKLRQPLARATLEVKDGAIQSTLQKFAYIIEEYTNVRHLDVTKVDAFEKEVRPIFAKIGPEFRENSSTVADALREANADDVLNGISSQGRYDLHTPRGVFGIREDHFTVVEKLRRENSTQFRHGIAYIDTEIDAGLLQEALVREFERRIQLIRKEMHLKKPDKIRLYYTAAGDMMEVIEKNREKIMSDINAETLSSGIADGTEVKEFDIDGEVARVFVERLPS
jgi:isoleucyl-tRNA synthetase